MIRFLGLWTPVAGFMAAVWFWSDDLSRQTPDILPDELSHFVAYLVFGLCNLRAFHGGWRRPALGPSLAAIAMTAAFGAMDEWRQAGVSIRDASFQDWLADVSGGLAAWLLLWRLPRERKRRPGAGPR